MTKVFLLAQSLSSSSILETDKSNAIAGNSDPVTLINNPCHGGQLLTHGFLPETYLVFALSIMMHEYETVKQTTDMDSFDS
jgi:hypothetical protein